MSFSTLVMVLVIFLVISFMTFRDMVVSGSLRGVTSPSIVTEPARGD